MQIHLLAKRSQALPRISVFLDPPHGQQRPASNVECHELQIDCKRKGDYFCP